MPIINVDLRQAPLIDAQLTVSYSHLNEVLRVIIENANQQDQKMAELQSQMSALQRDNEGMQLELRDLRDTQRRMQQERDQATDLSSIEAVVKAVRDDVNHVLDRQESLTVTTRNELEALDKKLLKESQSTSIAFSTVQEKWDHLNRAVIELQRVSEHHNAFAALWQAAPDQVLKKANGTAEEMRDFLVSLPAFQEILRLTEGRGKPVDDLTAIASLKHTEFTEIVGRLHGDIAALRNAIEVIEKRLRSMVDGDERLRECEERIRVLDATKADILSVSAKTDKDVTAALAAKVQSLQEELAQALERLGNQVDTHVGKNPRRPSASAPTDEALKRRVVALESETSSLEQKKADRSELTRLYEMVDTLTRGNPVAVTASPQPPTIAAPDVSPATAHKARPPSGAASKRSAADESPTQSLPPVEINTRGSNQSPQRQGSARPLFVARTSSVTVRDSSGGLTSASLACVTSR